MDLVVNGPFKIAIHAARCRLLVAYFQQWKIERLTAASTNKPLRPFKPPAPTLAHGLHTLYECVEKSLRTEKFAASMTRCCVKVGIRPQEEEGLVFTIFTSHTKAGTLTLIDPAEKSLIAEERDLRDEVVTFGEIATETAFEKRDGFGYDLDEEGDERPDEDLILLTLNLFC